MPRRGVEPRLQSSQDCVLSIERPRQQLNYNKILQNLNIFLKNKFEKQFDVIIISHNYHNYKIIMLLKNLLKETKEYLINTPKFIRLIFTIWFFRYFFVIILLANNINTLFTYRLDSWIDLQTLFSSIKNWIEINNYGLIIIIIIIFAIWYLLMYPVWLSAWIHFVDDKDKSISRAFAYWLKDFFLMFEFNWLALSFWEYTFITTTSRLFAIDILSNWIIIWLIILWWFFVLFAAIFRQYAKFILVLEKWKDGKDLWIFDAIKKSISLTFSNLTYTIKWYISRIFISILFYIRLIVVIAIPLLILYFLITSGIIWIWNQRIIRILAIFTILIATYLFVLIQAFFTKFQYEMYKTVKWENKE